jgi:hypothetical protein
MTKHFGELKILINSFNPMIISCLVLTLPIASVVLGLLLFSELSKRYLGEGDHLGQGLDGFQWAKGDRLGGTGIPIKLSMSSFHSLYHNLKNRPFALAI